MRKALVLMLGVALLATLVCSVSARDVNQERRAIRAWNENEFGDPMLKDQGIRDFQTQASVKKYTLVWYDFETMNWQGWTREDNTAQVDTFFHVDDFVSVNGDLNGFGGHGPIEGDYSWWCGAAYDPVLKQERCADTAGENFPYMCGWRDDPGYGNNWDQMLVSSEIEFAGQLTISYHAFFDSEPGYDQTTVEYDAGDGNWTEFQTWDGRVNTVVNSAVVPTTQSKTKIRFHFTSDGAWSDEDGLYGSDGACVIDSIRVSHAGGSIFDDMENCSRCDLVSDYWHADVATPFGTYSKLWNYLLDKDPCEENPSTQVAFFNAECPVSTQYPGLYDTPFCKGEGNVSAPCQDEQIVSPVIDITKYSTARDENQDADIPPGDLPNLGGARLKFSVYRDLPYSNLVFYFWNVRSVDTTGCPTPWEDTGGWIYYSPNKVYITSTHEISSLIGTYDKVQIGLGVIDLCDLWYLIYGDCAEHTPSPYFDDVRLVRYSIAGPQWTRRDLDIFQDNFPDVVNWKAAGSFIRADAANDIAPEEDWGFIRPGDSCVVGCRSPLTATSADDHGLKFDGNGDALIYIHVRPEFIGPIASYKAPITGAVLEGSCEHDDGWYTCGFNAAATTGNWTKLQMCPATNASGDTTTGKWAVDLNDELFTYGYRIEYYFEATDRNDVSTTYPNHARTENDFFEWTCLPTDSSGVLFVDDFHGRGSKIGSVEEFWNATFEDVLTEWPDRYDVNSPSSLVSNGPASRALTFHFTDRYEKVIWDAGNLSVGTICNGSDESDKSDDCNLLYLWMTTTEGKTGLWINGDDIACDLDAMTGFAPDLMSVCGVQLDVCSYYGRTGDPYPLVHGTAASAPYSPNDSFYVDGGCPIMNSFDVLDNTTESTVSLLYPDFGGVDQPAGIENVTYTGASNQYPHRSMWHGFSWMYVCNAVPGTPKRNELADAVFTWMDNDTQEDITKAEVPGSYKLAQNFPNPFNPSTTIKFDIRKKGHVSLKIYNVAGQLVRTLVNEVMDAGSYDRDWKGINNRGSNVASGVYFYKLESGNFTATKKMVLLR
jgi:hypothetical protein